MPAAARPIAGLPAGTCWIRWVDRIAVASTANATPQMTVFWSPLEQEGWQSLRLEDAAKVPGRHETKVSAGLLPLLAVGDVYRAGVRIGALAADERRFSFKLPQDSCGSLGVSSPCPAKKPDWWTAAWNVLPRSVFAIDHGLKAKCMVLDAQDGSACVAIPASETIRAFMAPHSAIALALASGPWTTACETLVDRAASGIAADGAWEVALGSRLAADDFAPFIANLLGCFNPAGEAAASSVYAGILTDGCLPAVLPFDGCRLEFTARGFGYSGNRWFAAEIIAMGWIGAASVRVIRQQRSSRSGKDGHFPVEVTMHPVDADDFATPVSIDALDAPDRNSEIADMAAPAMAWDGLPEVSRVTVPSAEGGREAISGPGAVAGAASVGEPSGRNSVAGLHIGRAPAGPACDRFEEIAAMLRRLAKQKGIKGWSCVSDPARAAMRGGLYVWQFKLKQTKAGLPSSHDWASIGVKPLRPRALLVCEIELAWGTVYWTELEQEGTEAFRALLFMLKPPDADLAAAIGRVMALARKKHGVWPSAATLAAAAGVASAVTWRHVRIRSPGNPDSIVNADQDCLNETNALLALETLRVEKEHVAV